MKNKNIFQEKLFNHTIPVRDGLWDAIEAQLPPKKEERIFPVFWFTLFASTLISGALMFGILHQNEIATPVATEHASIADQNSNAAISEKSTSSSSSSNNASTTSSTSIATTSVSTSKTSASTSNSTQNSTTRSTTGQIKKTSGKKSNHAAAIENSALQTAIDPPSNLTGSIASNTSRTTESTSYLSPGEIKITSQATEQRELTALHTDPNCYKFSGNTEKYALSADVFAGPGFSPRSFEQSDSESSVYADARKMTEHSQYAWSAGARINLLFRNGLGARLGLTYTQVGDIFDYTDTLATQSTTRVDSFFASDGTFLYADTSRVLIFGTLIKKIHNTYRYWDVPLLASFEVPLGRSLFMINAGPVFNLTSSHEGQILDPALHPGTITPGEPGEIPVYKTSLGLSVYLGAGIVFPITDHISGLVEPTFLYRVKPVTLDSYPLAEHRHYAGLNLGIRYLFD